MNAPSPSIQTSRAVRFLLSHLRPHLRSLMLGFFVLVAVDLIQLLIPRIIQKILDGLGSAAFDQTRITHATLVILLLAIALVVLRFLWRLFIIKPSRRIEEQMRNDLFGHLETLSAPFFNRTKTGDLMALFVNDIGAIRMATGMALIGLFDAVFMSAMSLAFMIATSPQLTAIVAAPFPLVVLMFVKVGGLLQRRFTTVQESFSAISAHTQESFSGIRVIKTFARERSEIGLLAGRCNAYANDNLGLTKVWGLIFPFITLIASLSFMLLLLFGGRLVMQRELTLGEFIAFTFYINLLVWPIIATGWVWNLFQRGLASAKRVLEVLDTKPDIRVAAGGIREQGLLSGAVEFKQCSFCYEKDGKLALDGVTFSLPGGSSLGVIGKPGSGKTTLLSLLFHQYPIDRAALFIDGRDVNDIPLNILRQSIAYVPQDSFLFSDTIAANIAFAVDNEPVSNEAVEQAAMLADVHRDIMEFPQGYETRIGERGVTLSGGQKQRLAIARALMAQQANILLLDDALSSVDAVTEAQILRNIRSVIKHKTSIIIAHRLSTIRQCDTIIVLDGGAIVEQGSHDELVCRNGFYRKLYDLQRFKGNVE